jgi:hypothetical protein
MGKKLQLTIALLAAMLLAGFLGCSAFMDAFTPCYIDPNQISYADANATTFLPFTTLWDARRIGLKTDYMHLVKQVNIERLGVTDTMHYTFLKNVQAIHIAGAEQFQQVVFSPSGPLGLLIPTILGTTVGAFLISKPSDKKKIAELQVANGQTNGAAS